MKYLVPCLVIALIFLHQDYWQWHDATLDFGFIPRALSYHATISVLAAITWAIAVRWCWPNEDRVATENDANEDGADTTNAGTGE
jgi:hypothetical protein